MLAPFADLGRARGESEPRYSNRTPRDGSLLRPVLDGQVWGKRGGGSGGLEGGHGRDMGAGARKESGRLAVVPAPTPTGPLVEGFADPCGSRCVALASPAIIASNGLHPCQLSAWAAPCATCSEDRTIPSAAG